MIPLRSRRPITLGCDTLVALGGATLGGAVLFGKNSDRPPGECQPLTLVPRASHAADRSVRCQYVSVPQVRETARVLGSRPVWLWGFEHGVNEHRVAIGNETVFAREAPAAVGLLGMDLVRLGLERAASAGEAVEVITELIERHGQGGSGFRDVEFPYNSSFLVADPTEAWIVEAAGRYWAARRAQPTDAISNHVSIADDWERLSPDVVARASRAGWPVGEPFDFAAALRDRDAFPAIFSEGRLRRSRGLLAADRGRLTIARLREILRDHAGAASALASDVGPESEDFYTLCMHRGPSRTAASMIVELSPAAPLVAWIALGRPCTSVYLPLLVAGDLPQALGEGSEEPSDALWWVFERLALAAESDPARAERIRETLDALQSSIDAQHAAALSVRGEDDAGRREASQATADMVARVAEAARDLLARTAA